MSTYVAPPTETVGGPSRIQLYEVTSVNANGTLNCRLTIGRTGKVSVPYPPWYDPQIGDRVYVADLNGNQQQPYVVAPLDTGAALLGAPSLTVGSRAAILFDAGGAGATFPATGIGLQFTANAPPGAILVADGLGGSTWAGGGVSLPTPTPFVVPVPAPSLPPPPPPPPPPPILPNGYATNGLGPSWTLAMDDEFQGANIKLANAGGVWGYGWYPSTAAQGFDPNHITWFGGYSGGFNQIANLGNLCVLGPYPSQIGGVSTAGGLTGSGLQILYSNNGGAGYNDGAGHTFINGSGFLSTSPSEGWNAGEPFFSIGNQTVGFYIESRMWLPGTGGQLYNWPSFWMTGVQAVNGNGNGFSWPTSMELDIMEGLGGGPSGHWHGASSTTGTFTSGTNTITGVSATVVTSINGNITSGNNVYVSGPCVAPQTRVTAASGTTLTLAAAAIGSAAGQLFAYADDNGNYDVDGGFGQSGDWTNAWHTYGALLDYNPAWGANGVLNYYYDGVLVHTKAPPFIQSINNLFVMITGGLGSGGPQIIGPAGTMLVDYVRVWHR